MRVATRFYFSYAAVENSLHRYFFPLFRQIFIKKSDLFLSNKKYCILLLFEILYIV